MGAHLRMFIHLFTFPQFSFPFFSPTNSFPVQLHISVTLKSEGKGQTAMSFVATGYSLIQSGLPWFHMGAAYITSEIQWYSPLTRNEKPQGWVRPWIYSWRLCPLNVKHTSHSLTRFSIHSVPTSCPKDSNDRKRLCSRKDTFHTYRAC